MGAISLTEVMRGASKAFFFQWGTVELQNFLPLPSSLSPAPSALRNPQENDNKKNLLTHVYCVTRGVPDFSFLRTVVSMAAPGTVRCVRSEKSRLEPVLPFGQETMHQPCAFYIQPPLSADFFEPASQPPSHALFSLLSTLSPQPLNRCCHLCRHHHHQYQTTITSAACLIQNNFYQSTLSSVHTQLRIRMLDL